MNRKLKKPEISDIVILVAISVLVLIVSYMLAAQLYDKSHLIPYGVPDFVNATPVFQSRLKSSSKRGCIAL